VFSAPRAANPAGEPLAASLPSVDDVHLVGQPLRLVHVVRGEHHGDAGRAQLPDQIPGDVPRLGVETRGGLVEEHQLRAPDEGHGQAEPALLTTRQPPVRRAPAAAQPQPLDQAVDRQRVRVQRGHVSQHLAGSGAGPRAAVLEHHADTRTEPAPVATWVEPQHPDPAGLRSAVPLAGLHRGRLARRRWDPGSL
jgi:hypothetical protein